MKMDCPVVWDNQIITKFASNHVLSLESEFWMETLLLKGIYKNVGALQLIIVLVGYISIVLGQLIIDISKSYPMRPKVSQYR